MARFEMGHPRLPGAGRQKGRPNNTTRNAREAISRLVEGNIDRLQGWLDEVAEKQGALAALRCLLDLMEYHVPKLTRAELTVENSSDGKRIIDSSNLSWADRQDLRAVLVRYQEIMSRYDAMPHRDAGHIPEPDDVPDADGRTAPNAKEIGDCNDS